MFLPPRQVQMSGFLAIHVFITSSYSDYVLPIFVTVSFFITPFDFTPFIVSPLSISPISLFHLFRLVYPSWEDIKYAYHMYAMFLSIRLNVMNLLFGSINNANAYEMKCSTSDRKSVV